MELFKLLGKIAIENEEALKALKEAQKEGEQTESKFSKFFGGIGKGAAALGKAIAVGLAAAATAVVGVVTSSINAYSEFEQLIGGSQLMFGEGFGFIEEQAKKAFSTVQMSQNEYLQQVNGFAVGLKTSLDGNEQAAAELAHKIIVAEADIIAATGNTQENVQNAFNGIMKSNFTMLDNLGLGITPTKEGFQEVIDKVNEWNEANGRATDYQIENLADCQAALVDYVEMQGMAGYASAEAAGTIQGSLSMVKASWENLLIGFSDPSANINQLVTDLTTSISAFAGNIVPLISNVLGAVSTALPQLVQTIGAELPGLLSDLLPKLVEGATGLVNALLAALPTVLSTLLELAPMLIDTIVSLTNQIVSALPQMIQMLVSALPTLIPQLIDGVVSMISTLASNAMAIIEPIITALPTIIVAIIEALVTNLPILIEGAIQLVLGIVAAIPQIIQALVDAIPMIVSLLVQALIENLPLLISGCVQLVVGLVAAIPQIFSSLIQAVGNVFVGIFDAVKTALEPVKEWFSNLWQSLGNVPGLAQLKTMVEEVWNAIKSYITTVVTAIKDVVSSYWEAIKNTVSTVINSIKDVISTVWNAIKTVVSNVMSGIASVLKGDWEGVKESISNILDAIKSVISSIWSAIKDVISSYLSGISDVVSSIWNGIKSVVQSYLETIRSVVSSVWNGIKSAISTVLNGIKSTATSAWNNIKNSISNTVSSIKSKVVSGFNSLKSSAINILQGMVGSMSSIGRNLVQGIWSGISGSLSWIKGLIRGWVGDVKSFIKNLFGIASPSKVMRDEVGQWLAKGIAEGIIQHTDAATEAMASLGEDVLKIAKADTEAMEKLGAESLTLAKENAKKIKDGTADMNNEVLSAAQKKLDTFSTYNEITASDEAAFWDFIRLQLAEGTDARLEADKKFFAAKKSIDKDMLDSAKKKLENYAFYNELTAENEAKFWDNIRQQYAEGTEERIEADKNYFEARERAENEILDSAKKKLDEYKVYNDMTLAEEVRFWEEISLMCEKGTDARLEADQKYLDAYKKLNEELLNAEETLQESLAEIHERIADKKGDILGTFDLFEEFNPEEAPDYLTMFESMENQIVALETYGNDMDNLRERIGDTSLFAELEGMGLDGAAYVEKFADMTDTQMEWYLSLYEKRNALANEIAEDSLEQQTIADEAKAWEEYAKTCAELGVEIKIDTKNTMTGVGKAIAEGVVATKGLTDAFAENVVSSFTQASDKVDEFIQKLKDLKNTATVFSSNPIVANVAMQGGGEGSLPVYNYSRSSLDEYDFESNNVADMVRTIVTEQNSELLQWMQKTANMMETYFPQLVESVDRSIVLDSGVLVGELADPLNTALGRLSSRKDRGR